MIGALAVLASIVAVGIAWQRTCGDETTPARTSSDESKGEAAEIHPGTRSPTSTSLSPSAVPSTSASAAPAVSTILVAKWGGHSLHEVGHERPSEGNPEGPMSLAVDAKGRMMILDQVNGRIIVTSPSGDPERAIPIKATVPQDVAVGKDGSLAVLDRLGSKSVEIHDASGNLRGELPIVGPGIDEGGAVTGVFVDGDDVYVEKEHGTLVRIGDTSGNPATDRTEIPGRPSRDGKSLLSAGITDSDEGRIYVAAIDRATSQHRFTRELRLAGEARSIVMLDSDRKGTIYVGVLVEAQGGGGIAIECLEPSHGAPIGSADVPASGMPEETFRDFAALDGGGVIYAYVGEDGVSYQRVDCH